MITRRSLIAGISSAALLPKKPIAGLRHGAPSSAPTPPAASGGWNQWALDGGGEVTKIETSTDGSVIVVTDSTPPYILTSDDANEWKFAYTSDISTLSYTQTAALSFQRPFDCKQAQTDPNRIYAVAGGYVFRSDDQGGTWYNTNTLAGGGFSQDLTNGQSVSPYGHYTSSYTDGGHRIYKHARQQIGIDPNNEDVLYVWKGALQGLFFSSDGGSTFTQVTDVGAGGAFGGTIAFDPASTTTVRGQTRSATVYVTSINYGVYRSTDGGQNFRLISDGSNQRYVTMSECASWTTGYTTKRFLCTESKFGGILTAGTAKTWQWDEDTSTFTQIAGSDVVGLAHDPGVPGRWILNPFQRWTQTLTNCSSWVISGVDYSVQSPTVAESDVGWLEYYFTRNHVYLTFAGGQFSKYWNRGTFQGYIANGAGSAGSTLHLTSGAPPEVGETIATGTFGEVTNGTMIVSGSSPTFTVNMSAQSVGSSGSPVTFTRSANKFWAVTGDGIFWCNPRTDSTAWSVNVKTKGQQELIPSNCGIVPDVGTFVGNYDHAWLGPITDPTTNPTGDPYQLAVLNRGSDIDYASDDHDFIVIAARNQSYSSNSQVRGLKYSDDGGSTWNPTTEWIDNRAWLSVGVCDADHWVAVGTDPGTAGRYTLAPKPPHYTTDGGTTWSACQIKTGGDMPTSGWHRFNAQTAPNSRLIAVDKVNPNIVYLSHRTNGIYKSTDYGQTFRLISETSTGPFVNAGYRRKLYTNWYRYDLYESGWRSDLWFCGFSTQTHLWHSTDGGVTWSDVTGHVLTDFDWGVESSAGKKPSLFKVYSPARVAQVFRSDDYGATWTQYEESRYQGGIIGGACNYTVSIAGDAFVWGRCYLANSSGPFSYYDVA